MDRLAELAALASYDFAGRSEDDVRGDWIEPLLRLLGYGLGTLNRIERGETLSLRPPFRAVGRESIKYDFKPTIRGRGLWIIEAKKPQDALFSDQHLVQMWTYATDPRVNVPLAVLCDGSRLGVFDVTKEAWDEPELDIPNAAIAELFDDLQNVLGARRVTEWVRVRQLRHLRTALRSQLDLEVLDRTTEDVAAIVAEVKPEVEADRSAITAQAREASAGELQAIEEHGGTWAIAGRLNGPLPPRVADVDAVVAAVLRKDPPGRTQELDRLLQATRAWVGLPEPGPARLWWTLRVVRLAAALRLVDDSGCGERAAEIVAETVRDHLEGFPDDDAAAAAHRLELVLGPYLAHLHALQLTGEAKEIADRFKREMDPEDWLVAEGRMGMGADEFYMKTFNLTARALFFGVEPWTATELDSRAADFRSRLDALPEVPAGEFGLAHDPLLRGWLEADPLIEHTLAFLRAHAAGGGASAELARVLLAAHNA
jgi:hypothetical protein